MNTILQKRIEEAARECDYQYEKEELTFISGGNYALKNQWVSVEEALPEEKFNDGYQFVFVRIHLYDDTFYYDTDYIKKGKWELHKNQKITHWMEIPSLEGGEK